jgi:hypothetical protein
MTDPRDLKIIHELIDCSKKYKSKKKPTKYEIEDVRKNVSSVVNHLIEYSQRKDIAEIRKMQMKLTYGVKKEKHADIFLTSPLFILIDGIVKKIKDGEAKLADSNTEEFDKTFTEQKGKPKKISSDTIAVFKKEFGEFELEFL